jgi:hypothetical protein
MVSARICGQMQNAILDQEANQTLAGALQMFQNDQVYCTGGLYILI